MQLTYHEEVAEQLAATPATVTNERLVPVGVNARQGDVLIKTRPGASKPGTPTPAGGYLIQAGANGEHRLFAPQHVVIDGVHHLADGGLLVHTDKPSDRHHPLRLAPGCWHFDQQEEMSLDGALRAVRD